MKYPEVSGAEHLKILKLRDKLAELEVTLTSEEQESLAEADRTLAEWAAAFHSAFQPFLDLTEHRREHMIPSERRWWYVDAVRHVPGCGSKISSLGRQEQ